MITNISDRIRREYEKETSKKHDENGLTADYVRKPTWDYVCWLESKLDKFLIEEYCNYTVKANIIENGSFICLDLEKEN